MVSFIPTRQWAARGPPPTSRSLPTPLVSIYSPEMGPPTASFQERSQMELGIVADFSSPAPLSHVSFQKEKPLCQLPVLTCADLMRHHKCPSLSGEKGQGWLVYRELQPSVFGGGYRNSTPECVLWAGPAPWPEPG